MHYSRTCIYNTYRYVIVASEKKFQLIYIYIHGSHSAPVTRQVSVEAQKRLSDYNIGRARAAHVYSPYKAYLDDGDYVPFNDPTRFLLFGVRAIYI